MSASQQLDIKAILEFEQQYRRQIKELHGKLTLPYIDVAKKLPIDRLYVCPHFSPEFVNRDTREKTSTQSEFYQSIYRTVLLGNPGGGKSTCGQKCCYDLVTQFFEFIRYVFISRYEKPQKYNCEVEAELNKCNFNQEQRDFIWKWIRREINLVAITDS